MHATLFDLPVVYSQGHPFIPVLTLLLFGQFVAAAMWLLATVLGPRRPSRAKDQPFEFGNPSKGVSGARFAVKYYLVTLFFLVFDLEAVFIYPWATQARRMSVGGVVELCLFLFFLTASLVYVWRKGALKWES